MLRGFLSWQLSGTGVLRAWELCVIGCVAPFYAVGSSFQVCLFLVGVAIVRLPASTAPALGVGLGVLPPQLGDSVRFRVFLHRLPVRLPRHAFSSPHESRRIISFKKKDFSPMRKSFRPLRGLPKSRATAFHQHNVIRRIIRSQESTFRPLLYTRKNVAKSSGPADGFRSVHHRIVDPPPRRAQTKRRGGECASRRSHGTPRQASR